MDNSVFEGDEEQEMVLDIGPRETAADLAGKGMDRGLGNGAATPSGWATADQHQKYLAAIICEHKVKVEPRPDHRREALVVDVDTTDEDVDERVRESYTDDDDDDDEGDDDNDEYVSEDHKGRGNKRGEGRAADYSLFYPLDFSSISEKEDIDGNVSKPRSNGVGMASASRHGDNFHPTLSYSSSSDTAKPPKKTERKVYTRKPGPAENNVGGGTKPSQPPRANGQSPHKPSLKSSIENSGGVRVFPLDADIISPPYQNGRVRHDRPSLKTEDNCVNHQSAPDTANPKQNGGGYSAAPPSVVAPQESPPARRVRSIRPPPAYSDFKDGLQTAESDLESFAELTDL